MFLIGVIDHGRPKRRLAEGKLLLAGLHLGVLELFLVVETPLGLPDGTVLFQTLLEFSFKVEGCLPLSLVYYLVHETLMVMDKFLKIFILYKSLFIILI